MATGLPRAEPWLRQETLRAAEDPGVPNEIQDLASTFVDMQKKRNTADYDPDAAFSKLEVIQSTREAEDVIRGFTQAPRRNRRAFAVYLLFDSRS